LQRETKNKRIAFVVPFLADARTHVEGSRHTKHGRKRAASFRGIRLFSFVVSLLAERHANQPKPNAARITWTDRFFLLFVVAR
jgi:hypothetical protein